MQEIGRCGRDGSTADCFCLYADPQDFNWKKQAIGKPGSAGNVAKEYQHRSLAAMKQFVTGVSGCR